MSANQSSHEEEHEAMTVELRKARSQRGVTLFGLLFWAIFIGFFALVALRVLPTINEYFTLKLAVEQIASSGATTDPEIRTAFDKQAHIDDAIASITGKDLEITKVNDKVVIAFAYDKEI